MIKNQNNIEVYYSALHAMRKDIVERRSKYILLHRRIPYEITLLDKVIDSELDRLLEIEKQLNSEIQKTEELIKQKKYKTIRNATNR